ncbi:MAG: LPS-assembly protein LptD [Gammaproteobacteria bacterium]|nr:LPS-assembly protein LptD [Gammaproteobacteria bacterium]
MFCSQVLTAGQFACTPDAGDATFCEAASASPTHSPGTGASPPPGVNGADGSFAASYWLPRERLPAEMELRLPAYCSGAYQNPVFPYPLSVDDNTYPIETSARRIEYLLADSVTLVGGVHIDQGNRSLESDRATIDLASRDGSLIGGVRVTEPGLVMMGERATVNLATHAAKLDDVQFLMLDNAFRGEAGSVIRDDAGNLEMVSGTFTRCEPGSNSWQIAASTLRVGKDDVFGIARNAVVRVKDVPIFYFPYLRFPLTEDRQSGFLFPSAGYSSEDGIDVSLPYYLNLAPNYDATVIPRVMSNRGPGLEVEFRHLSGWEETTLSGAFLYDDDLYNGKYQKDDFEELKEIGVLSGEFKSANRWLYAMDHQGRIGPVRTIVDYTAVSDRDYFHDLGTDLAVSSRIELERRGELRYSRGGLAVRLWAQRFDRLDEVVVDPYQRLPELVITYGGKLFGPLGWSIGAEWVSYDRKNENLAGRAKLVGERVHLEPRVRLPFTSQWGFLTLMGGIRHTSYQLRDARPGVEEDPVRNIGFGSLNAGLFFERELDLFQTPMVQTLEPRVYYLYQEYDDQRQLPLFDTTSLTFGYNQLFRDNRFSGLDRIGDANQLSAGITTRFLNAATGFEYLRASIGEIIYFEDRRVTLSGPPGADERQASSALAGKLTATLNGSWRVTGSLVWDPHDNQVDEGAVGLQYRLDNRRIVNLGYRNRVETDIEQTDFSIYWPISRGYSLIGRWNYDLVSGRTVEGFAGIEYNNCCWQVRLLARRFIDSRSARDIATVEADNGVFLQIVFKGLAGLGTRIESVLERGIKGYRAEAPNDF